MSRFLGDLSGTSARRGGEYRWLDGAEKYPSVTAILGTFAKPDLLRWYAAMERQRICERVTAVKEGRLKGGDITREYDPKAEWTPYAEEYRDARGDLGSAVHKAITAEVLFQNEAGPMPLSYQGTLLAHMKAFVRWYGDNKPDYHFIEGPVYSRRHGYAGTADGICTIDGKTYVVDYKVSAQTFPGHALQMAAYAHADFLGIRNTGQELPLPKVDGGLTLLVHEDGCKAHYWPCSDVEFQVFLAAREVYLWRKATTPPKES